ncbi:MAG: hypothetical protein D6790_04170 [Caldilineae bacterium]|nr:MAG: hypothetical protein D6790_04170 [Caldilineae bacterium]
MTTRIMLILAALFAAACTVTPPATAPPAATGGQVGPVPAQIQVWDGAAMRTYAPGEAPFAPLSTALTELLGQVGERARTFYTPQRFREEITARPYVLAEYDAQVTVTGKGLSFPARSLVVTLVDEELLLLAQAEPDGDWSVYLPSEPDATSRFIAAVREATGVDLAGAK